MSFLCAFRSSLSILIHLVHAVLSERCAREQKCAGQKDSLHRRPPLNKFYGTTGRLIGALLMLQLARMTLSFSRYHSRSHGLPQPVADPPHCNPSTMYKLPRIRIVLYA